MFSLLPPPRPRRIKVGAGDDGFAFEFGFAFPLTGLFCLLKSRGVVGLISLLMSLFPSSIQFLGVIFSTLQSAPLLLPGGRKDSEDGKYGKVINGE